MQTELTINEDYKETFYVICKKPLGTNEWLFHHKYSDLGKAKSGLRDLMNRNNRYEYKIRKFVIKGIDLITDETFPLIENRETCDCFHCGKTIEAGDELIFGQTSEEIYCSHECVSLNRDNEEWTALSDPDEYLPWFPEKEGE